MLLYMFIFRNNLNNGDNVLENNIYLPLYNYIANQKLNLTNEELDNGIWKILIKYKDKYPFINQGFKQYFSIAQLFSIFDKDIIP